MVTIKPRREAKIGPEAPTPANGKKSAHATASPAMSRPEATTKRRKGGTKAETDQVGWPDSAHLVADVRSGLGVTRELFARMTGFSVRAISGWEAGRPVGEPGLRRFKEMKRLRDALAEGMREGSIPRWLEASCEGLGGLKPVEILERGETDRLWRVVLVIGSGMPT